MPDELFLRKPWVTRVPPPLSVGTTSLLRKMYLSLSSSSPDRLYSPARMKWTYAKLMAQRTWMGHLIFFSAAKKRPSIGLRTRGGRASCAAPAFIMRAERHCLGRGARCNSSRHQCATPEA